MTITLTRLDPSRDAVIEYTCPLCGPFSATFADGGDTFVHSCELSEEEYTQSMRHADERVRGQIGVEWSGMTYGIFRAALVVVAAIVSTGVLYALAGISVPVALGASIAVAASMAWMIGGDE